MKRLLRILPKKQLSTKNNKFVKYNLKKRIYNNIMSKIPYIISIAHPDKLKPKIEFIQGSESKETFEKTIIDKILDIMLESSKETFVTEAGDVEEWRGGVTDKTQIIKDLQEYIVKLKGISEA